MFSLLSTSNGVSEMLDHMAISTLGFARHIWLEDNSSGFDILPCFCLIELLPKKCYIDKITAETTLGEEELKNMCNLLPSKVPEITNNLD
jgi:hypothetical protein